MNPWADVALPYLAFVGIFYAALVMAWLDSRRPAYRQSFSEREQRVMVWIGLTAPVWPFTVLVWLALLVVVPVRWGWRLVKAEVPSIKGHQ